MEVTEEKETEKQFVCSSCKFKMKYDYYGTKPQFLKSLVMLEDAYILRDPFSTEGGIIIVGAHCSLCSREVCVGAECSVFFSKRFCLDCVNDHLDEFPEKIKQCCLNGSKFNCVRCGLNCGCGNIATRQPEEKVKGRSMKPIDLVRQYILEDKSNSMDEQLLYLMVACLPYTMKLFIHRIPLVFLIPSTSRMPLKQLELGQMT